MLFTFNVDPEKVKFASPFKLTPLPPVMTRLSALFAIVTWVGIVVQETALPEPPLVNTWPDEP